MLCNVLPQSTAQKVKNDLLTAETSAHNPHLSTAPHVKSYVELHDDVT